MDELDVRDKMKKLIIITICVAVAVLAVVIIRQKRSVHPPPSSGGSPFQTIATQDGTIVATLRADQRWLVVVGTTEPRLTKPEESFTMLPEAVIRFHERHSNYQVTAQLSPVAGLVIESTFDARSFGDGITKETYFIAAK